MRVVIDGLAIQGENSLSIVSEQLLAGWDGIGHDDELHLVLRDDATIDVPPSVTVHRVALGRNRFAGRLRAQSFRLPRLCRRLQADVMLGMLPSTALMPLPCPHAVIAWDFRYRVLPRQFRAKTLLLRRASYGIGFRQTDAVACISERTRGDLLRFHPRLSRRPVQVAHLGADHVESWPAHHDGERYAIAFGHLANKNLDLVLEAWFALDVRGELPLPLRLVGVCDRDRPGLQARVDELGLERVVTVSPWLADEDFRRTFASASLVVFPSDFEGFGLPAVEAMRLGIPVVITPEPALLEVTDGRATVIEGDGPEALARAVDRALRVPVDDLALARQEARRFTWGNFATDVRGLLTDAVEGDSYGLPRD